MGGGLGRVQSPAAPVAAVLSAVAVPKVKGATTAVFACCTLLLPLSLAAAREVGSDYSNNHLEILYIF